MTNARIRSIATIILAVASAAQAAADIEFLGPDLSADDKILFTARVEVPGEAGYDTLFAAELLCVG